MNNGPKLLLPNVGAEESHRDHDKLSGHPAVVHLGELWLQSLGAQGTLNQPGAVSQTGPLLKWSHPGHGLLPWFASNASKESAKRANVLHLGPTPECVQLVHNKGFAAELAAESRHNHGWEYSHVIKQMSGPDEAETTLYQILAGWPEWARADFTIKPCMGSAGRGRIAGKSSQLTTQHIQGLYKMTLRGGAIVEPWYSTLDNLSTQLLIHPDRTFEILGHTSQILTTGGSYLGNYGILKSGQIRSSTEHDEALTSIARSIVPFIKQKNFYGVCGFDSFTFSCPVSNQQQLRSPLEFNARFTSATVGISHVEEIAQTHSCNDGSWAFILDAKPAWCEYAQKEKTWTTRIIRTATTQKQALISVAQDPASLPQWLKSIGLKT